ncbi:MAG: MiaB/RimO family radical SAM methylthiotransferase, partial [Firmicutes bacterium]|nr:MiaB/RimO family radical SAM methylthiotransferase [Bacillota bacterium]
ELPGVDLVVGTRDRKRLVDLVESAAKGQEPRCAVSDYRAGDEFEELPALPEQGRARAFLKIQEGCTNFCTYCIVPYARGPLRSRKPASVLDEAVRLAAAGYKELVLTGIHTGAYGRDLPGRPSLAGLIGRLSAVPGLRRLRLSSIEPNDITPGLVEAMAGSKIFCRHLHIPLQSGDDGILKKMGRRYTAGDYARLAAVLRENLPGLGLTTDVMVGFPGEGEEEFANTVRLVEKIAFSGLHVFKFSPRRGTPAATFPGQIDAKTKERRSARLIALGERLAAAFAGTMAGRTVEVLVEQPLGDGSGFYEGFTDNYVRAAFPAGEDRRGEIVRICVERLDGALLWGRIIT